MPTLTVIFILAAAALGVILGAWLGNRIGQAQKQAAESQATAAQQASTTQISGLQSELEQKSTKLAELDQENRNLLVEKAKLEEQLKAERAALKEAEIALIDKFGSLAAEALSKNNTAFLELAKQKLETQQKEATNTLDSRKTAIETLLKPVAETLAKLETHTHELETKREGAYQAVVTEIKNMQQAQETLRRGTTQLIEALRKPQVRGNWGQQQLERCIEFAGMVKHVSFDVEVFVRGEEKSIRPDCVVNLPNHRTIIIDVKTPLESLLSAAAATDESERAGHLADHARRVKEHLNELSSKTYHRQFKESPDFVVCFLPSEASFSAALEQDPNLIEFGSNSNVILATPTTLIALLKAVAYGWQQMEITRNAIDIREAGKKLYDKLATAHDHFSKLGNSLSSTIRNYNNLVGSVEGRGGVFSLARKLHELGIGDDEITESPELESSTRHLVGDDWIPEMQNPLELAASRDDDSIPNPDRE